MVGRTFVFKDQRAMFICRRYAWIYKKHEMYEKIADEFNEETFSKRQI